MAKKHEEEEALITHLVLAGTKISLEKGPNFFSFYLSACLKEEVEKKLGLFPFLLLLLLLLLFVLLLHSHLRKGGERKIFQRGRRKKIKCVSGLLSFYRGWEEEEEGRIFVLTQKKFHPPPPI